MTEYSVLEAGFQTDVAVLSGPLLLRGVEDGDPGLRLHRQLWPEPEEMSTPRLVAEIREAGLTGRGGASFPLWRKLEAALDSGRKRELVVNAAEGEPASAKDSSLIAAAPHLVLDGAQIMAEALDVRTVHLAVPGERPSVIEAVQRAVDERWERSHDLRFEIHPTTSGFVGGQSHAVLELLSGRENLPVTARQPAAVAGLRGRPTLLSNAETLAQLAALCAVGPHDYAAISLSGEPGTRLLSVAADGPGGVVIEVPHGEQLMTVLQLCGYEPGVPVLIGGYHGTWLSAEQAWYTTISPAHLREFGAGLGAGVILPMLPGDCPISYTSQIVSYLAGQRAQRCGPCTNGLPTLADTVERLAYPEGSRQTGALVARLRQLCTLVSFRGACAHPDGTARLVSSMLETFEEEVRAHLHGACQYDQEPPR
jgi:NADH:ubiquinone oxidoreductase subunit F (NADH-binding)